MHAVCRFSKQQLWNTTGSTTLFHHIGGGKIILSRIDGGLFDLISIDIAELPTIDGNGQPVDFGSFDITFIGTRADASNSIRDLYRSKLPRVTTFQFSDFSGLAFCSGSRERWRSGASNASI